MTQEAQGTVRVQGACPQTTGNFEMTTAGRACYARGPCDSQAVVPRAGPLGAGGQESEPGRVRLEDECWSCPD